MNRMGKRKVYMMPLQSNSVAAFWGMSKSAMSFRVDKTKVICYIYR